jgi:hypothetical protein
MPPEGYAVGLTDRATDVAVSRLPSASRGNGLPSYQHSKCAHAFRVVACTAFSSAGIGPWQ